MIRSSTLLILALSPIFAAEALPPVVSQALPVKVTLTKAATATVVIERSDGFRVSNLVSDVKLDKGVSSFTWDLYDVGTKKSEQEPYIRRLVEPGTYTVRGLVHDGIVQKYDMSVYSPGTPAWKTLDHSGAWMGDHTAPNDALFLPKGLNGKPGLVFAAAVAECGAALAFTDLNGRKYTGVNGDNFNGAEAVAIDVAPKADDRVYFYNVQGLCSFNRESLRHEVLIKIAAPDKPWPKFDEYNFMDLAIWNGFAVLANSANRDNIDEVSGDLRLMNLAAKSELSLLRLPARSRGVAFSPDGTLFSLVGKELVSYTVDASKGILVPKGTVVTGLSDPRRVRLDQAGTIYISEHGALHQVKVFDKAGKLLRTIGKPGGGQIGAYDELRMDRPDGMALTPDGTLWVAENSCVPKRVSAWNAKTGAFITAIYGGPAYAQCGSMDPQDDSLYFYQHYSVVDRATMVFKLDHATGTSKLTDIVMRTPLCGRRLSQSWDGLPAPEDTDKRTAYFNVPEEAEANFTPEFDPLFTNRLIPAPSVVIHAGGHRYLAPRPVRGGMMWFSTIWRWDAGKDAKAVPVAIIGDTNSMFTKRGEGGAFDKAKFRDDIFKAREAAKAQGFVWSDLNHDQLAQASEIQFITIYEKKVSPAHWNLGGLYGPVIAKDLSFTSFHNDYGYFAPPTIDAEGVPVWDLSAGKPFCPIDDTYQGGQKGLPIMGTEFNVLGGAGWEWFSNPRGYRKDGTLAWAYRYYDQYRVPQFPGQLVAGNNTMGQMVKPAKGEAGEIWATGCDKGSAYLFTADGLYLKNLAGDVRTTSLWRFPEAKRGMIIDGISWEDECFSPSLAQNEKTKTIYVITGKEHNSLLTLEGLETVKRQNWGTVTVTAAMLAGLPPTIEESMQKQQRKTLEVPLGGTAPKVDGKLDEWAVISETGTAKIDGRAQAKLWLSEGRIFAAFTTGDAKLIDNSANDPRFLFKAGGALDLYFGAKMNPGNMSESNPYQEGDCRILIAKVKGKPTAILYRPVHSGAETKDACVFESPIGKEVLASVTDITSDMQFAEDGAGNYEVSFAQATVLRHKLGENGKWAPVTPEILGKQNWHMDKTMMLGDVGIIRGNGQQNVQRVCWNSLDTWMTSDVPSEVRWRSINWGALKLVAAP